MMKIKNDTIMTSGLIILCSVFLAVCYFVCDYFKQTNVVERMMDSVVYVNGSSGVVVYSDIETSLVLTAYHVVEDMCGADYCDINSIKVGYGYVNYAGTKCNQGLEFFNATKVDFNADYDLALIEVKPGRKLDYSTISKVFPSLGDDVFLAANPAGLFRSLKKGIVSSLDRCLYGEHLYEISGGVVSGSSGGGVFNVNGGLVGIITSNRSYEMRVCFPKGDKSGEAMCSGKVIDQLAYLGFAAPLYKINDFVNNSVFCEYLSFSCKKRN